MNSFSYTKVRRRLAYVRLAITNIAVFSGEDNVYCGCS